MALGPMAWMAMTLAVVILSLTFGPGWSLAFLILVGVIFGEVPKGKQEEQEKQNLLDSAPARDAPDHVIDLPADASDHAPADAPADAPAHVVDVPADGLALSVDAPTPVVDAPAFLADAPAPSGDSLAPAVDAPADAALSVDAPVDAPAISVDAQVDAPVDASALAPAVVAAGIRMRRNRKSVLKLYLHDDRDKRKAMKVVSAFDGVGSLNLDTKDNKLTVIGDFDVDKVVDKLRKYWHTEIVSVGPAKEDEANKNENPLVKAYQPYYSRPLAYHYVPHGEEKGNCVIC